MGFTLAKGTEPDPAALRTGTYLTDGTRLLRIESELITLEGDRMVEIEDCASLDRWVWPAVEIGRRGLHQVDRIAAGQESLQ